MAPFTFAFGQHTGVASIDCIPVPPFMRPDGVVNKLRTDGDAVADAAAEGDIDGDIDGADDHGDVDDDADDDADDVVSRYWKRIRFHSMCFL